MLAMDKLPLSKWLADIFSKTAEKVYRISRVARYTGCIFRVVIPFWFLYQWDEIGFVDGVCFRSYFISS